MDMPKRKFCVITISNSFRIKLRIGVSCSLHSYFCPATNCDSEFVTSIEEFLGYYHTFSVG